MTTFRRRGHWRTNSNGTSFWVDEHNVSRDEWDSYSYNKAIPYQIATTIKHDCCKFESFVNPNTKCPICGASVFYYESPYGGKVYFDSLGPPWPKHPCINSIKIEAKRQYFLNKWQYESWKPLKIMEIEVYENNILKIIGMLIENENKVTFHIENAYYMKEKLLKSLCHIKLENNEIEISTFEIITTANGTYVKEHKCLATIQKPLEKQLIEKTVFDINENKI